MAVNVSNPSADRNEKISNAAKVLGHSKDRKAVFLAVYSGKKIKTTSDLLKISKLSSRVRVLQEINKLVSEDIVKRYPERINSETAYEKIDFYRHNKTQIIRLSCNKKELNRFPTRSNPQGNSLPVKIILPKKFVDIKQLYVEDLFPKTQKIANNLNTIRVYESLIKKGIQKIIGEKGKFQDWGGERNDLFSTRIKTKYGRKNIAFGFKGKGTKGLLTLKKMGKNGDQIPRLYKSPADIFIVQYCGEIDESILDLLKSLAEAKSAIENKRVYYGIIDGIDTAKLLKAYSKEFKS